MTSVTEVVMMDLSPSLMGTSARGRADKTLTGLTRLI
jgi:hypothetical protein